MRISRREAQKIVAENSIDFLSDDEVYAILSEYWIYDNVKEIKEDIEKGDLPILKEEVISFLSSYPLPQQPDRNFFKPLIIDYQVVLLDRVLNSYLEGKLKGYGIDATIEGKPKKTDRCPCCKYYSLAPGDGGKWDICTVCFWENGGSGPNRMTLFEAQNNFKQFGAINKDALAYIDQEGSQKYTKESVIIYETL